MSAGGVVSTFDNQRVITCGLCFNVLSQPLTFNCRHSYCTDCVKGKIESQNANGFACPLCNLLYVDVTVRNLQSFADTDLAHYVKMMADGAVGKLMCQWCEEIQATIQCNECLCVYCIECSSAVHKSAAKRGHITGKIGDPQSLRGILKRCGIRTHEEYRAEFYCTDCEELCCAYCLQVGPHKGHENIGAARAASDARQKITRDMSNLMQTKTKLENQASDLNRVTAHYFLSYDSVENLLTERFEHFRQQLMQREVELRKTLASLRDSGDASLTSSRKLFLLKLNALNEGMLRLQRMQHGGTDLEVLGSRSAIFGFLKTEVPAVGGTGFRISDLGDMVMSGLDVTLDLQLGQSAAPQYAVNDVNGNGNGGEYPMIQSGPPSRGQSTRQPSEATNYNNSMSNNNNSMRRLTNGAPVSSLRLTFPVDDDVEAIVRSDGVLLRCVARSVGQTQIGVRSKETMETVANLFPEDAGLVSWQVRLENISESFVGVVEKVDPPVAIPDGFYWRPTKGTTDGRIGRLSPLINHLPICRNGDLLRFTYDRQNATLRVAVNGIDRGVIISDLHPRLAACFIFYPGESLTVLF